MAISFAPELPIMAIKTAHEATVLCKTFTKALADGHTNDLLYPTIFWIVARHSRSSLATLAEACWLTCWKY